MKKRVWAPVPPPLDMSDFDRDVFEETPPSAPPPVVEQGVGAVRVKWEGEDDDDDWD